MAALFDRSSRGSRKVASSPLFVVRIESTPRRVCRKLEYSVLSDHRFNTAFSLLDSSPV